MSELKPCKKLGFGFMRLPKNSEGKFDMPLINNMVDKFLEKGFTYFDTAYVYEGSEVALGESLVKRHPRESYTIADKLPVFLVDKPEKCDVLFKETLSRLGTDYVDYYLVHGLDGKKSKEAEELGVWDYIAKQKELGTVKHMGFSFHGTADDLDEILTRHPEAEFCQLQINYLDWESEDVQSRRCYEVAR
ncbi:MAG: aldo/keto reductase, partial [Oscillospiraceae bacterium]|nr:aldo/keto reductase [Oscillospiraceae bacterium]